MTKRFEGRDEVILDRDIPIIDAHIHLFDHPALRYMFDEYLDDTRAGHRIVASVYVETRAFIRRDGPEMLRPLGEIEFANGVAAMSASGHYGPLRACAAIVGYADLRFGAAIDEMFAQGHALAPGRFRGIRQSVMEHPSDEPFKYFFSGRPPVGTYQHPKFREGFARLAPNGLTFDATGFHLQIPEVASLADAFPDTTIILNHMTVAMGLAMDQQQRVELFRDWRAALIEAAKRPNILCKIGGMGMPFWGFGFDAQEGVVGYRDLAEVWRPFVETAIEQFGPNRCIMESNYPPDARSCGYVPLWNALKHIVAGCTKQEKADLFYGTAARTYRIDLAELDMSDNPLEP
jgi:L-fuconolactonase